MFTGKGCLSKKAKHIGLMIVIVSSLVVRTANAADDSIDFLPVLKFAGGMVSSFVIHEGAHALVAGLTGTSMDWKIGDVNQPINFTEYSKNKTNGFAINSAGLLVQMGASEFILFNDKIDKNDSFIRGMIFWNIVNPLMYAVDYWFIHKTNTSNGNAYMGDLKGIEFYSNRQTAEVFTGTMVALVAFEAYRYAKTQSWAPEWLKDTGNLEHLSFAPLPSGGALLSYTSKF